MGTPTDDVAGRRAALAQALKAVRRRRGLRPAEAARRMDMPLRSFEYFESGRGRLNVERIHAFAAALDADPLAILTALDIDSPAFAVRCADNKLMTILTGCLEDFDAAAKDDIAQLGPQVLIQAFTRLFAALAAEARARKTLVSRWRSDGDPPGPDPRTDGDGGGEDDGGGV
jgi:transcriptional regulator with XRE-family HTH domain